MAGEGKMGQGKQLSSFWEDLDGLDRLFDHAV